METFNGFRVVPVSGSGGPGVPGAQGPQGYQGVDGHSGLQWTAVDGTQESIYPGSGEVNIYSSGGELQLSFSTTTGNGVVVEDWFTDLRTAVENDAGLFTISQVSNRTVHRTVKITGVSEVYASGGSNAVNITGEVISSAGNIYAGRDYFGHFSPLGALGFQGPQGEPETIPGPVGNQGAAGERGHYGLIGPQGVQGVQGVQGPQGAPSSDSEPGPTGYQGNPGPATGYQGHQGVKGPTGSQGAQGGAGPQGDAGHPGDADPGDRGVQGTQGSAGPQGLRGTQGSQGATGGIGQTGYTGSPGPLGSQGAQSASEGPRGTQGAPGTRGSQGTQGVVGHQGTVGFVGIPGPTGTRGPQGYQGTNFSITKVYSTQADRTSATGGNLPGDGEYGVIGGDETSSDYGKLYLYTTSGGWTYKSDMSLQGIQGPTGDRGNQGPQGYTGHPGSDVTGDRGTQGSTGSQGSQGTQGYQGNPGTGGSQGTQGDAGPQGYQGNTVLAPNGTGVIYISGGSPEVVTLDSGLMVSGSLNSRVLRYKQTSGRPALDSNHIHVYNCDEAPGSTVLVDSGTGGKNLTLQGGEGTLYSLGAYRFGSSVPWLRGLIDNDSQAIAKNSTLDLTTSQLTIEFVAAWTSLPTGDTSRIFVQLKNSGSTQSVWLNTYDGYPYGGVWWLINGFTSPAWNYSVFGSRPSLNTPYHIMYTYRPDGGGGWTASKLYINGVYIGQSQISTGEGNLWNMSEIAIGGTGPSSPRLGSPCAYIRDIRISNIVRDATYAFNSAKALLSL